MSLVGLTMLTLGPVVSLPPPPTTAAEQLTALIERARQARLPRKKGTP